MSFPATSPFPVPEDMDASLVSEDGKSLKRKYRIRDLTGMVFGRLSVLERDENSKTGQIRWKCICTCGNIKTVQASNLKNGAAPSCGCLKKEVLSRKKKRHGMTFSREYHSWQSMRQRCLNTSHKSWDDYGGRGIKICPEWLNSFEQFYQDMGPRPEETTLEREDVNGHYCKENCVWATHRTQAQNRRNTVLSFDKVNLLWKLKEDGIAMTEIAKMLGTSKGAISGVVYGGAWKK